MKARRLMLGVFIAQILIPTIVAQQEEAPWWAAASVYHFPHVFATDLEDFVPQLKNSTADFVLIDFYAPWCPHCQHFAPDYERLALAVQKFDAAQAKVKSSSGTSSILSATVDCQRFAKLCDFWNVHSYPTLMWGRRDEWVRKAQLQVKGTSEDEARSSDGDDEEQTDNEMGPSPAPTATDGSMIDTIDTWDGTAESVATWINNRTKFGLDISAISKKEVAHILHQSEESHRVKAVGGTVSSQALGVEAADVWDAQLGAALLLRDILQHHAFEDTMEEAQQRSSGKKRRKHVKPRAKSKNTTRSAFVGFVGLLAQRFPASASEVGTCRQSLHQLHSQLRNDWAGMTNEVSTLESMRSKTRLVMIDPDWLEGQWRLCDEDWSRFGEGWHQCRGTWPGKRGYTCGLWNMFHFLAAQTSDEMALRDLQIVRNAVVHFFDCTECRDHFMKIPVPEESIKTRRDAQLWWWNAHNVVNRRVGKLEQMYEDGDPGFPKAQWPSEAECPTCRHRVGSRRKGLRGTTAETVNALGVVTVAPPEPVALAQEESDAPPEVPVEFVNLADAVAQEHWDLHEVAVFLERRYNTPTPSVLF